MSLIAHTIRFEIDTPRAETLLYNEEIARQNEQRMSGNEALYKVSFA